MNSKMAISTCLRVSHDLRQISSALIELGEFRSGSWDKRGSSVKSGVSMDGRLQIDLTDYTDGTGTHTLVESDALDRMFV